MSTKTINIMNNIINRFKCLKINNGSGAGGRNTNKFGLAFEEKTNNEINMILYNYSKLIIDNSSKSKRNYMYSKKIKDKKITYVCQSGLKIYMKKKYNIKLFRHPDEAYIIETEDGGKILKILEKKEQNQNGSVETKLWASPSLKREYELLLSPHFKIEYALCVSNFLEEKLKSDLNKYKILSKILSENNIHVLFGDDDEYFNTLKSWILKKIE